MAMQGGTFDENDYARLTGTSLDDGDDGGTDGGGDDGGGGGDTTDPGAGGGGGGDIVNGDPVQTITPAPGPGAGQNVNQDNDISNIISGSGNTVTNNQDNRVSSFGGGGSWKDAWMKDYFS